jgi:polyhydroxybutyrate depolymerase
MDARTMSSNARVVAAACIALVTLTAGCSSSKPRAVTAPSTLARGNAALPSTATTFPSHRPRGSTGCARRPPSHPGVTDNKILSGGVARSYQLDVPTSYNGTKPYALVFGLHSLTVDYRIVLGLSGFVAMAPKYQFISVSPSGLLNNGAPFWNAAPVTPNYDVTFLTQLLDHLEATLCVDTAKIFSVGMSNGAQMSSLLACRIPKRIAGIAPIAGVEFNEPCPGAPVPLIAFHGTADPFVPYKGGGLNSVTIANQNFYKGHPPAGLPTPHGVDDSMRLWAQHNGCAEVPIETRISQEVLKRAWPNCKAPTVLYIVKNGGHTWPGKPQPGFEQTFGHTTTDIDATALIFAFFFSNKA